MTGRLRRNSTHGASGTATAAPTASAAADSIETSAGPAWSTVMATSGNAPKANCVPNELTAKAPHSHPNRRPSLRRSAMPTPSAPACHDRASKAEAIDRGNGDPVARRTSWARGRRGPAGRDTATWAGFSARQAWPPISIGNVQIKRRH